jgi:hypothetical protein
MGQKHPSDLVRRRGTDYDVRRYAANTTRDRPYGEGSHVSRWRLGELI